MERVSLIVAAATLSLVSVGTAPAAVVFDQDFSSSPTVSSYVSATPNSGQFNDISADGTNNTVAIANDDLVYDMNDNGTADVSGFLRSTDLASPVPTVLAIEMVFTYTNNAAGGFGPGPTLQVGNYPGTATNYGSGGSSNDRFDDLVWRRGGSTFTLELNDTDPLTSGNQGVVSGLAYGVQHNVLLLLNNSGSDQTYTGPDGIERVLNSGRSTLFVNDVLGVNNSIADDNGAANIDLSSLRFRAIDVDTTFSLDRITVSDVLPVPEPASLSMLAIGGLLALRRRSR